MASSHSFAAGGVVALEHRELRQLRGQRVGAELLAAGKVGRPRARPVAPRQQRVAPFPVRRLVLGCELRPALHHAAQAVGHPRRAVGAHRDAVERSRGRIRGERGAHVGHHLGRAVERLQRALQPEHARSRRPGRLLSTARYASPRRRSCPAAPGRSARLSESACAASGRRHERAARRASRMLRSRPGSASRRK